MNIVSRPSFKNCTTLGMGGQAQVEVWLEQPADWDCLTAFLESEGLSPLVVGRGSNLLVQDGDLPLCLVRLPQGEGPQVLTPNAERPVVRTHAGQSLPGFLSWLQKHGLAGLEGLAGIPANVGGAVAMNAGSFGQCIGQCLHRVRCWSPQTGLVWVPRQEVQYAYRHFRPRRLGGAWIVYQVEFLLDRASPEVLGRRMGDCFAAKRRSQPVGHKTCGCTFKNPQQAPAGRLLDLCGMRGRRCGDVGFSSMHANFLINWGRGTFAQAREVIDEARSRVRQRYGVSLQLEVHVVDPLGKTP